MKICFFTENYYKGGLDTFLVNLFNAWPDSKDELTLVCNGSHSGLKTIITKTFRPIKIERYYRVFTSAMAEGHSTLKWIPSFPVHAFFLWAFRLLQFPMILPWYVFTLMLFFLRNDLLNI